eukprot:579722-Amphidinium_carterae.1
MSDIMETVPSTSIKLKKLNMYAASVANRPAISNWQGSKRHCGAKNPAISNPEINITDVPLTMTCDLQGEHNLDYRWRGEDPLSACILCASQPKKRDPNFSALPRADQEEEHDKGQNYVGSQVAVGACDHLTMHTAIQQCPHFHTDTVCPDQDSVAPKSLMSQVNDDNKKHDDDDNNNDDDDDDDSYYYDY